MKIIQAPSPNHDQRALPISLLVLHYTGMETGAAALAHMCSPEAKVSAHYMVEEDGRVFQLVDEMRRAWHAGISSWEGEADLNSATIGIEIVNGGHDFGLPVFPGIQIDSVCELAGAIMKRHKIPLFGLLAHSDIAPSRKKDPGELFPWQALAAKGIGVWPELKSDDCRQLFGKGMRDRGVSILQTGLAYLGYGIEVTGVLDAATSTVITAFQRRYRPSKIDGCVDVQTMEILTWLAETKKKNGSAIVMG